jgi:hypothetical protein
MTDHHARVMRVSHAVRYTVRPMAVWACIRRDCEDDGRLFRCTHLPPISCSYLAGWMVINAIASRMGGSCARERGVDLRMVWVLSTCNVDISSFGFKQARGKGKLDRCHVVSRNAVSRYI